MKRIDAAGIAAIIIAVALGAGWAGSLLILALHPAPISQPEQELLSVVGGGLGSALAAYIGAHIVARTRADVEDTTRGRRAATTTTTDAAPALTRAELNPDGRIGSAPEK